MRGDKVVGHSHGDVVIHLHVVLSRQLLRELVILLHLSLHPVYEVLAELVGLVGYGSRGGLVGGRLGCAVLAIPDALRLRYDLSLEVDGHVHKLSTEDVLMTKL